MLADLAVECYPRPLICTGIVVFATLPTPLLPVRHLASLHNNGRRPQPLGRPGHEVPDGLRCAACADHAYAHGSVTPTEALVEAKIFSPLLTLSYTDSALAKNGSFGPLLSRPSGRLMSFRMSPAVVPGWISIS